MRVGVPREERPGERLVAATPATVARLAALGHDVVVQAGAGVAATFPDEDYVAAGAVLGSAEDAWACDVVTTVHAPAPERVAALRPGAVLISVLAPAAHPDRVAALAERGVTALALDAVPRISRAQSLDVLSTLSNVSGYRGVVEAAQEYGGMFAGQVTAAGKTPPATVFVIGAGVAGLAAIGTAVSLGAQVRAFDVRPEAAEQIESMGATVVRLPAAQQERSTDGYASALTAEQERATAELYARECAGADVVVTTALVRGTAPTTVTAAMVATMRPGSVVVDLAASGGGNCELTVPGERVVTTNGVVVLGWTDLPSRMPRHTSQLFGTNVVHLLELLTPDRDGALALDLADPVQRGLTVAHEGQVLWPPPPVAVSAEPAGPADPALPAQPGDGAQPGEGAATSSAASAGGPPTGGPPTASRRAALAGLGGVLLLLLATLAPPATRQHLTVFVLAVVVGFYVIRAVRHSLHTPLMSQTNAISGIILVGALLQLGSANPVVTVVAAVAAALATVNVVGGFLVTYRMLGMFRKDAA